MSDYELFNAEAIRQAQEKQPFARVSDIIYEIMESAIINLKIAPGSRLNLSKIASALNVSNSPVREAIDNLEKCGLVVSSVGIDGKYKTYSVYEFDYNPDHVFDLFQSRKAIEGSAAYICAEKNWLLDLESLDRLADQFYQYISVSKNKKSNKINHSVASEYDRKFHKMIIESCNNDYLKRMYSIIEKNACYLSIRTCDYTSRQHDGSNLQLIAKQHQSICFAIKNGFSDLAKQVMERHIDFCYQNFIMIKYALNEKN